MIKQYCIEDVVAKLEVDYSDTLRNVQNMYETFVIVFHIIYLILLSTIKNPKKNKKNKTLIRIAFQMNQLYEMII